MSADAENKNAIAIVDGFDLAAADPNASPLRGPGWRFKDGDYVEFSDVVDVEDKTFAVLDRASGWQKLAKDCPPEFLIQRSGAPRPLQPSVPTTEWPLNLNGKPEHPWKWTRYLYLLDVAAGTIATFWSNTVGGRVACDELTDQIAFMRRVRPGAIPLVALESRDMPTSFGGTKPRPYFRILGWRTRGQDGETVLLPAPDRDVTPPVAAEIEPVAKAKTPKVTKLIGTPVKKPTTEEIFSDSLPF
jgi:hypothetical protein